MIINVDNQKEFVKNISLDKNNIFLGAGAAETALLVGNKVYKLLYDHKFFKLNEKKVITTADYNLDSFIFPDKLICFKDNIKEYQKVLKR